MNRQPSSPLRCALSRALAIAVGGSPGEVGLVGEHQFEGIGGIQDVLRELGGDLRQLDVDLLQSLFARRIQIGAVAPERLDGFVQEAAARAAELRGFGRGGVSFDIAPQARVQWNAGVEGAHLGLRGIECRAQLGIRRHALQVAHHTHRPIQRLGQLVQRVQRVVERALPAGRGQRCQPGARFAQQLRNRRLHVLRADAVERNAELYLKKRVGVAGTLHYFKRNRQGVPGTDAA